MRGFRSFHLLMYCLLPMIALAQNKVDGLLEKAWTYTQRENDSALVLIRQAASIAQTNDDPLQMTIVLEAQGLFYEIAKSDYQNASSSYMEGLRLCEKHQLPYAASLYHALGVLFHTTDNYQKALDYYGKALSSARRHSNNDLALKCQVNLASVHSSLKHFDTARALFERSLTQTQDPEMRRTIFSNLGNLEIRQGNYRAAIAYLNRAIQVNPETNTGGDIMDYSFLLDAKTALKDFDDIRPLLQKSDSLYRNTHHLRKRTVILKSIGNVYEAMGDYRQASAYKDRYIGAYDSLKNVQRDETVYELETKYQTDKKEEEILKRTEERNRLLLASAVAVAVILLLGALVLVNIRHKRALNRQKTQLEKLVDEKNLLLRETHHRVKNSFQIVSGLLYLQAENMQDKEAALAVKEAQNRVKSMILIHQKLYSKAQLVGIDSREYIEDLVYDIIDNQARQIEGLQLDISAESLVLSIDTITPIGLIINELITNIIKHAFPAARNQARISITFCKTDGSLLLVVADNGCGMAPSDDHSSFGLKLIRSLARQLKADIAFENDDGLKVTLRIGKFEEL